MVTTEFVSQESEPENNQPNASLQPVIPRRMIFFHLARRIVLLVIAFLSALGILYLLRELLAAAYVAANRSRLTPETLSRLKLDWTLSWTSNQPVANLLVNSTPNSIYLVLTALLLTFIIAILMVCAISLVQFTEGKNNIIGIIMSVGARLLFSPLLIAPSICLAIALMIIFSGMFQIFPPSGATSTPPGGLFDRLVHLVMPALSLALLPATFAALALGKEILAQVPGWRRWLWGLFNLFAAIFRQGGGILSGLVVIEILFGYPGLGNLMLRSSMTRDYPVILGCIQVFILWLLVARLLAEGCLVVVKFLEAPSLPIQPITGKIVKITRPAWLSLTLILLVIALAFSPLLNLTTQVDPIKIDSRNNLKPPSPEHPWGTDQLGRDLMARVLSAASTDTLRSGLAALLLLFLAGLGGALVGFLAGRKSFWLQSLADLLLLPTDIMLFFPYLCSMILTQGLLTNSGFSPSTWLVPVLALTILPRAVKAFQSIWLAAPSPKAWLVRLAAGVPGLFLAGMWIALTVLIQVNFVGLGVQPPALGLGNILADLRSFVLRSPALLVAPILLPWIIILALFLAADALLGFLKSKDAFSHLNS